MKDALIKYNQTYFLLLIGGETTDTWAHKYCKLTEITFNHMSGF